MFVLYFFIFIKEMTEFLNCTSHLGKKHVLGCSPSLTGKSIYVITQRKKRLGHLNYQCHCSYEWQSAVSELYLTCDYFAIMDNVNPQENRWYKHILNYSMKCAFLNHKRVLAEWIHFAFNSCLCFCPHIF